MSTHRRKPSRIAPWIASQATLLRKQRGFTLLEVMVAVAILATALTAIFASEAGAIKVAHRARKITGATLMARCKMGEIEELIAKEGLPAIEKSDTDHCCEGVELESTSGHELFTCDWKIETIVLPEMVDLSEDQEGAAGPALGGLDPTKLGGDPATAVQDLLGGGAAGGGEGGGDVIGEMALTYAYPIMKPVIEAQVRKATVTVQWQEGSKTHSFSVMQFLVAEQPAAAPDPTI